MSSERRTYGGSAGSAIKLEYPRASRQTEEQARPPRNSSRQPQVAEDYETDEGYSVREKTPSSAIRYGYRNATRDMRNPKRTQLIKPRRPLLGRVLIVIGLSLLLLSLGITAYNALASWWQWHTDDVTYGMPRTSQTDQFVGHGDSPAHPNHFIAINLEGKVEVIEFNTQQIKIQAAYYITTTNPSNPVTLTFPTIGGKQYMYISIGDSGNAFTVAMVNDGQKFAGMSH